MKNIHRLSTC